MSVKEPVVTSYPFIWCLIFNSRVKLNLQASENIQIFFTVVKLALIASLIIGGLVKIGEGYTENFEDSFAGTSTSVSAWAIAIYNGMWSYDG